MQCNDLALTLIRAVVGAWFLMAAVSKSTLGSLWGIPYPTVAQHFIVGW
jgi:hypothetical protein